MCLRIETLLPLLLLASCCQTVPVCEQICEGETPSFSKDGRYMAFQRAIDNRPMRRCIGMRDGKMGAPKRKRFRHG